MAAMTYLLHIQWSEVWRLPLWLWRDYVETCEAIIKERAQS